MFAKKALGAAPAAEPVYIEDVFSTYLYTGNGSTQTITNGIDLAGEGGLVWIKSRSAATNNFLFDTERGVTDEINSNTTDAEASLANSLTAFNSDGFNISSATGIGVSAATYCSWTFRKAEKFFDVVTYTGNGSNRTIAHNLGSVPGCIIVKRTDTTGDWQVYHRANTAAPETDYLVLNTTATTLDNINRWNDTLPTSTVFSLGTDATVNANGGTYVAYIFAHDAGGFGDDGDQNVITCGSFTGNYNAFVNVTLGYEPQFVLWKCTNYLSPWYILDNMRGWTNNGNSGKDNFLSPNTSAAESSTEALGEPNATGFRIKAQNDESGNSGTYVYIAIRRGPMKTPESGTEVYKPFNQTNGSYTTGWPIDLMFGKNATGSATYSFQWMDRLRGVETLGADVATTPWLNSSTTDSEGTGYKSRGWNNNGSSSYPSDWANDLTNAHAFRRAPGFFDMVCDTGTGSAHTISHNLGVVPELMIRKKRSAADNWVVYAGDATDYLILNSTAATADLNTMWNDTAPTASVFTVGTNDDVNGSGATFVTYLFASVSGVSKVGSYTGNGSSVTVTTDFQPRFILVKRTDSTGNWIVGDSARGLVAGSDPYLLLNSTAAEDTDEDWVDVSSTGFTVNETSAANANVNTGTYIYLAIA